MQNPFVEQNDARTQGNPKTVDMLAIGTTDYLTKKVIGLDSRNVESRVNAIALGGGGTALELAFILVVSHGEERTKAIAVKKKRVTEGE